VREPEPATGPARDDDRSGADGTRQRLMGWAAAALPTISRLGTYRPALLRDDVVAGLALTAVLVPVGMGYAEAAGLPAIAGLYATIGALIAYFLVGPSKILVLGPDSSLLPLVAAAIVPLAAGDPARSIALAGALTIMAGILCLVAALARLGFVTDLLSRPIRVGYMNGIALIIVVSQLPKLLGFSVDANDVVGGLVGLAQGVVDGKTVPLAAAIGIGALAIILVLRTISRRIPGVLVAVILAGVVVAVFGLSADLAVVGEVPRGLPAIGIPAVTIADLGALFPTAVGIALISFADTSVISRSFAARRGERVDADRELAALGVVNVAAGLVGGFASSGSATRTPVAEAAGSRTQVTGLVGAVAILAILVVVPGLLAPVPTSALAAVVISAALSLFDVDGLRRLWRQRRSELGLALVAFLAVVLFGALPGIAVAVGLSLLNFIRRAWRPHDAVLGRVANYKGYHDTGRHPEARLVPGLVLYRWDAPLFFANADLFRERALEVVDAAPPPVRWLAVTSEPVTDIDTTATDMLDELITELARRGIELHFAELKGHVKDRLRVYGVFDRLGADHFHPTIGSVVKAYLARHPDVTWLDWEDEPRPPEHEPEPEVGTVSRGKPRRGRERLPSRGSPAAGGSDAGPGVAPGAGSVPGAAAEPAPDSVPGTPAPDSAAGPGSGPGGIRRSAAPRQPREPGVDDPAGET
jgi:high affinity sulfate transporter 1